MQKTTIPFRTEVDVRQQLLLQPCIHFIEQVHRSAQVRKQIYEIFIFIHISNIRVRGEDRKIKQNGVTITSA